MNSNIMNIYVIVAAISFGLAMAFSKDLYETSMACGGLWTLNVLMRLKND